MKKFILITLSFFILAVPSVHAQANLPLFNPNFTIVPQQCTQCPCGYAGTLQLIQNLMNLGIAIGILIMILVVVYAGALFLFSPTNPGNREMGKSMLTNAVIGIVIVLSAWLVVDAIMKALYNPEASGQGSAKLGPWNTIIGLTGEWCIVPRQVQPLYDGSGLGEPAAGGGGGSVADPITGADGCPNCVSLSELGISCKSSSSCSLESSVADRAFMLWRNYSGTWTITEAYPPTVTHSNPCHKQGTCFDVGFRGNTTYEAANVAAFMSASQGAGLRAVFETTNCDLRTQLRNAGLAAYCKADSGYSHITGTHFSVYAQ